MRVRRKAENFEAMQFISGWEGGKAICDFVNREVDRMASWSSEYPGMEMIQFRTHSRPARIYPGYWVVYSPETGYNTFTEEEFFDQFDLDEKAEMKAPTINIYNKHDEIVAVNENPEIITNIPKFKEGPGPVADGYVGIEKELEHLLNRYSAESVSGTPDFILAKFLIETLKNYNEAVSSRAEWRGELCEFKPRPTNTEEPTATL